MGSQSQPVPVRLSVRKKLLFAAVAVLGALALLEGVARLVEVWRPPEVVDYGLGFDRESRVFKPWDADPDTMVTQPSKRISFQPAMFAARKPAGCYRIFVLGGSTVFFLEHELGVLRERLQTALAPHYGKCEVVNVGGAAYGSQRLVPVAREVLSYEPDLVLLQSGHNEFEEVEQLQLASLHTLPLQRTASHSALMRFCRDRITAYQVGQLHREHNRRILGAAPDDARAWKHEFAPEDVGLRMKAFRDNTALVIAECQRRAVPIVIATVPSNLVKPYLTHKDRTKYREVDQLLKQGRFDEARARGRQVLQEAVGRHQSSDLENDVIRSLAREYTIPLADIEEAISATEPHGIPGETLFVDHCHLTPAGNRIARETFEKAILTLHGQR